MKQTFKIMLALMAGTLAFAACQKEVLLNNDAQLHSELKEMTFTAIQEGQDQETKTTIDGTNIKWASGDKISVFDGGAADAAGHFDREFVLSDGAGTTAGKFSGSAADDATTYYALYPYMPSSSEERVPTEAEAKAAAGNKASKLASWSYSLDSQGEEFFKQYELSGISEANQNIIIAYLKSTQLIFTNGVQQDGDKFSNVVIPAEQTATTGSADPKAMLMMAKSTDANTLQFKNICAYVKVTPKFDCIAICLRSKGTQNLVGTVTVDYNNGEPSTTVSANGSNEVFLTGTITADNAYYIAVRPETLSSGFTIEFLSASDKLYYARSSGNDPGLVRSKVKSLGEFTTSGTWDATANGLATSGDDGSGHGWQLVTPTLRLAKVSPLGSSTANCPGTSIDGNWDSGKWAVPSRSDISPLLSSAACSYDAANHKAKFGAGVLRYSTYEVELPGAIWLSDESETTVHPGERHLIWDFAHTGTYSKENTESWGILYRYTD